MKRVICASIAAAAAAAMLLITAGAADKVVPGSRGDISGDGSITASDYITLRSALLFGRETDKTSADITGDGRVNAADYAALRLHLLGIRRFDTTVSYKTVVSGGCPYTISGFAIGNKYPDTYASELTDRVYAPADSDNYFDSRYVGLSGREGSVTLDLGKAVSGINAAEASWLSVNEAGIYPPSSIDVQYSADGKGWASAGSIVPDGVVSGGEVKMSVALNGVTARYVRFSLHGQSSWVFVDEFTVYADVAPAEVYDAAAAINDAYAADMTDDERAAALAKAESGILPDTTLESISVSDGCKYTLSAASPVSAHADDGVRLTDGVNGYYYEGGFWTALPGGAYATVDLGGVRNDLYSFSLNAYGRAESGIALPPCADIAVSSDGKTYYSVGRAYSPVSGDGLYEYTVTLERCVRARYVRFTVCGEAKYSLISEISAYARAKAPKPQSFYPDVTFDTSDTGAWANPTTAYTNLLRGLSQQLKPYFDLSELFNGNDPASSTLLTDGVKTAELYCYNGKWFHCRSGSGRYIVYDLGHISALRSASGGFLQYTDWGVSVPESIKVYISSDAETWYLAGEAFPDGTAGERKYSMYIPFAEEYTARYVCFDIAFSAHLFIDELEVSGRKSLAGARDPAECGLAPLTERGDIVKETGYQAPSDSLLGGVNDVVLAYYCHSRTLDRDYFLPYVGYIKDGKITDTMFDGFLFLPTTGFLPAGGQAYDRQTKPDWVYTLDELFASGRNLEALNAAAGEVKSALGLSDYKYKFFVTIMHPSVKVWDFGDIDGDGVSENLTTPAARLKVVKWFVNEFYSRYDPADYPNLEFCGWYWFHEAVNTAEGDAEVIRAVSSWLHSRGEQLFWIPYFTAEGYSTWESLGFDVCCMQPNYAFNAAVGSERIGEAAELIRRFGMCIEIEIDGQALTNELFFQKYMDYLAGGSEYGYMTGAIHMYYEAAGLFGTASRSDGKNRLIYDYTYEFIKKKLRASPETPELIEAVYSENTSVILTPGIDGDTQTLTVVTQPKHGTVAVNGDGTMTYYPNRGYTGDDSFAYTVGEYLGSSDEAEIRLSCQPSR